jgi:SPFH domain / Band 7 family
MGRDGDARLSTCDPWFDVGAVGQAVRAGLVAGRRGETMGVLGEIALVVFVLVFGAFWIWGWSVVIMSIFSVKVEQGEIIALHRPGSGRVESIRTRPGRYWRIPPWNMEELRLRVDEPIAITSRPVEAGTFGGASAVLTVRLIMDVTNSARYATVVVGKQLEAWREEVLPALIAHVVAGQTFAQVLNDRGQVAQGIAGAVANWFSDSSAPDFGLAFKRAAIVEVTSPPLSTG